MNYDYCDGMIYTIKKGDTLYSISRSRQVPLSMLLRANPYVDVYNLQVGDTICIPMKRKPCKGKPCRGKDQMQDGQNVQERGMTDVSENIQAVRDEAESEYGSQEAVSDTAKLNASKEVAATTEEMPNSMTEGNGMMSENGMAGRNNMMTDNRAASGNRMYDRGVSGGSFTKYVTQPGDTLADVMARSDAGQEVFWEKNAMDRIHLLPGISYLVFEETE